MIDVITHRFAKENRWLRALVYGSSFLIILLIVQWPFANILMASRGHWFFGTSKWYFGSDPNWAYRYEFGDWMVSSGINLVKGIAIALAIAILSARIGLAWGHWMKKIMR